MNRVLTKKEEKLLLKELRQIDGYPFKKQIHTRGDKVYVLVVIGIMIYMIIKVIF